MAVTWLLRAVWYAANELEIGNTADMFTEENLIIGSIRNGSSTIGTFDLHLRTLAEGDIDEWLPISTDGEHHGELHVSSKLLEGPNLKVEGAEAADAEAARAASQGFHGLLQS